MAALVMVGLITVALGAQGLVLIANLLGWKLRRLPAGAPGAPPAVSVLIPARNERHHLPLLLAALRRQSRPPLEILICDDGSEDGTREWLQAHGADHRAAWFGADPRPPGWLGKNWACHLLGGRARGDWLLFLDADVEPEPAFLQVISAVLQRSDALLATAIPAPRPPDLMTGLLQAAPLFSVFTLLPLRHAERRLRPSYAFANGQVMAFRRDDYQQSWPHRQVRDRVLEDVELARWVKRRRGRIDIVDLTSVLTVRMYRDLGEAMDGFAKNAVSLCRGPRGALLVALAILGLYLLPLLGLASGAAWPWATAFLTACLFGTACWMAGLPPYYGPLYPVAFLLAVWVLGRSLSWHRRGEVRWKGRVYPTR